MLDLLAPLLWFACGGASAALLMRGWLVRRANRMVAAIEELQAQFRAVLRDIEADEARRLRPPEGKE